MNKLFTKIAAASLSLAMAVGVGVAVSQNSERVEAAAGTILAQITGSKLSGGVTTYTRYANKTDDYGVSWTGIAGGSYFGINSAANNTGAKAGVNVNDLPVAKGVDPSATSSTATTSNSCTGYYVFYTNTQISNAGSIEFSYTGNSGNSDATGYVVYSNTASSSGGTAWTQIPLANSSTSSQGVGLGTNGTFTFTFAETQTTAKYYGFVIATTSYKRMTSASLTIKEGASAAVTGLEVLDDSAVELENGDERNAILSSDVQTASAQVTCEVSYSGGSTSDSVTITSDPSTGFSVSESDNGTYTMTFTSDNDYDVTIAATDDPSNFAITVTYHVSGIVPIVYEKIKTANNLKSGAELIIGTADGTHIMGEYSSGNYIPELASVPNAQGNLPKADLPTGYMILTLGGQSGEWTLQDANDNYLARTGDKTLKMQAAEATWTIDISSSGVATITNTDETKQTVKYNSGSPRFSVYTSGQTDVSIYMLPSTDPAISVTVTSGSTSMVAGDTATLTAELLNGATGIVNWSKSNNNVTLSDETGLTTTVTSVASGSSTVTASLTNGSTVDPVDIVFTIRGGTADCPYTVAEARAAIDASEGMTNVYTTGIVSQVDSFNSDYGSITYWISDDGTTTNQLEVYGGLDLNGAQFTDINGVMLGDTVTVFGTLKKYGSTYEYDKNNYLTSHSHAAVTVTSIDSITGSLDAVVGAESWDLSGLVVNGTLNSGSTIDITAYVIKTTSAVPGSAGTTTVDVVVTAKEGYGTATATIGVSATVREISGPIADGRYYIMNSDKNYGLTAVATDSKISVTDLTSGNSLLAFDLKLVDDNEYEITVTQNDTKYYLVSNTSAATGSNDNIRIKSSSFTQNYSHTWHLTSSSGTAGSFIINQNNTSSSTRYLAMYNSADWRGYANTEQDVDYEIQFVAEKSYAEAVADKIPESCASGGSTTYDATVWGQAKDLYNAITISGEINFLKNGHADKESSDKIERALEKYDYAVARYKLTGADAFITDRVPGTLVPNSNLFVMNSEATTAIIVIVTVASITAIGAIFFIRRRRYN